MTAAEVRQLLKEYQSLTSQSRAADNSNQGILSQLQALLPQLQAAAAEGFDDAGSAAADVSLYIRLIEQKANQTASSGQIVKDDQQARADNSNTVKPGNGELEVSANGRVKPPPETTSGSNAVVPATGAKSVDSGTNGELRPTTQTQSTPAGPAGAKTSNEDAAPTPGGKIGVAAKSDDSGSPTGAGNSQVVTELNSINFTEKLVPQDNILDQYSSYTYQASLYLMTKDMYQRLINTGKKDVSGAKLLVQSGGASAASGVRAENFDLDYYIDRIELKSAIAGKATGLAHNVNAVKMTVIEPNGVSFIDNIDAAVQKFFGGATQDKKKNFTSQIYLLVIRFYGYDDKGNLVRAAAVPGQTVSTSGAVTEKWYPLSMAKVNFKIASKLVEYQLEFIPTPYYINAGSKSGTIPFNIELSGGTLKDILAGPVVYGAGQTAASENQTAATQERTGVNLSNANAGGGRGGPTTYQAPPSAPPKADAANTPKKTVRQGLMAALNEYQKDLVTQGIYQFADEYNIEFALDSMASATIMNPGLNKGATSMAVPSTAADQKLGTKQSMDSKSRVEGATAGTQIVQFIDNLVRNSSYIRDQQLIVIDEKTGAVNETGTKINNTAWYKIGFRAEAMIDKYDEKRNDYAYRITYTVSPYKISQLNSPYFQVPKFNGTHKKYNYWFTGENTQVLSYEETLNSLYYAVLSGENLGGANSNANELLKYQYQTASGQSTAGADGKTLEPAANAADQLYNPSDLKECTMSIIGDPAWLQQGESLVGLRKGAKDYYSAFLDDGTINFDSQQVLFEVGYNTSKDYDLTTGLMEIDRGKYNSTSQQDQQTKTPGTTKASRIYVAKECTSEFARGKFTQTLKGSLMIYYPPKKAEGKQNSSPANATVAGSKPVTKAPKFELPRSGITNPVTTTGMAKGVQQILHPATQADTPSLTQLQASPVYIQARRNGASAAAALASAKSAFAAGTNNAANFAAPGIRTGSQLIVKDQ